MPPVEVNDMTMYCVEAGHGQPLVLLEATGVIDFSVSGWGAPVPTFAEHYRTFHVEHRGHGARPGHPRVPVP